MQAVMHMDEGRIAELTRRGVVAVGGADARKFLDDLITSELARTDTAGALYGGLLTPQGKILFDFIVMPEGNRFLFDLPGSLVADFIKRLGFYRLRAKVDITDLSAERSVVALWGGDGLPAADGPVAERRQASDATLPSCAWMQAQDRKATEVTGRHAASGQRR